MGRYTEQVSAPSQHSALWVVRPDTFDPGDGGSTTDILQDVKTQKSIRIHATVETKNLTSVLSQCFALSFVQNICTDSLTVYEISPICHFHTVAMFFFVDFITRISYTVCECTDAVCPYQMPKAQRFSTAIAIKRKANTTAMSCLLHSVIILLQQKLHILPSSIGMHHFRSLKQVDLVWIQCGSGVDLVWIQCGSRLIKFGHWPLGYY